MKLRLLVASIVIAAAALAAAAFAASPQRIVATLNAERVANGIPGGITLNHAWTVGCTHHVRYEELNGIPWTHEETPGKPGYTKDGQMAGGAGDQQSGLGGWDAGDPFDRLPIHLANLLAPTLQQIGAFESGNRSCVMVALGNTRQIAANTIYADPGPGRSRVPTSQTVHGEWPASPGDVVGLPQGTTTGPTIYVIAAGPWIAEQPLHLAKSSLHGPHGVVTIRVVDPRLHPKIAPYVAPGVFFLIPVSPLAAGTTYSLAVTITTSHKTTLSKAWRFRTG
jgi:hypothetical protein